MLHTALKRLTLLLFLFVSLHLFAQTTVVENKQKSFPKTIPPGNYSGITWLGGNRYAVVSDKSETDGFFIFEIEVDSISGEITSAENKGFFSAGHPNRDGEGIAYNPHTNTIFISGEADNVIKEYGMDGKLTGRIIPPTPLFSSLPGNLGLEALSYNANTHTLWTCNEATPVFLQSYNDSLQPEKTCRYSLDAPVADKAKAQFYAHGIGTVCALDDGSLLVLEREFYVPHKKIGSFVNCKLFLCPAKSIAVAEADTTKAVEKEMLLSWRTSLNIFKRSIANYEGICLGPVLADGSRVVILVADSQNQYRGVLRDWLKSLKLSLSQPQQQ